MRMTKASVSSMTMRMTILPARKASIMKLTVNTAASSRLNIPSSSPTINIFGTSVHVQRMRERSLVHIAFHNDFSVGKRCGESEV